MDQLEGHILPTYDASTVKLVQLITKVRQQRRRYFENDLFGEPAWDILLALYAAALVQRRIAVTALAEEASLPQTTTLRWLHALHRDGLVERTADPIDARRVLISLSEQGLAAMDGALAMIEQELSA